MGLMEPGCTLEDFGRPAQPAAPNRLRCRANWWCLSDICVKPLRVRALKPVHGLIVFGVFFLLGINILLVVESANTDRPPL
jgi:hypothetical protein